MAMNVDSLNIQISANATEASNAIDTLVKSLQNLNAQLGLKDGTRLTKVFQDLTKWADSFSGAANRVNGDGFERVARGAKEASEAMKNLAESAKDVSKIEISIDTEKLSEQAELAKKLQEGARYEKIEVNPTAAYGSFHDFFDVQERGWTSTIEKMSAAETLARAFEDTLEGFHFPDLGTGLSEDFSLAIRDSRTEFEKLIDIMAHYRKDLNGASFSKFTVPEFDGKYDFNQYFTGWVSDIPIETSLAVVEKLNSSLDNVSSKFKTASESAEVFSDNIIDIPYEEIGRVVDGIEAVIQDLRTYKKTISDLENGKRPFNEEIYREAVIGAEEASKALSDYKKNLTQKVEPVSISEVAEKLELLGNGFERLSKTFGSFADKGVEIFKKLITPIKIAGNEYIEKFKSMQESVADFQKNFQAHMKKASDFWKRTMKTFTFMVIRSAITAIMKEVGTAVQSLALFSNAMDTAFNTDLSSVVADFQFLGRSIVSIFAPLLNYVVPIIDAIVDRIAILLSYIGMLFTALGGGVSFTKAKKNVTNYAESLDKASKSTKNLTMGIDELNILSEKSGGSAKPYDGWEDAWEQIEIPDWINDLSNKIKDIFKDLFEPFKRAWDLAKDYVLNGWKIMTQNMKTLLSDIWRDFMRVWKSDTVTHIFYNLLMILGDIERVIGNIALRFDEAWNEGEKGFKILSNIASIVDILVQHLRNVTQYMIDWAASLNFNPLLESIEYLTRSFKDLAEFIGQVFEDVMERVVLKYLKFLIEEGIPDLNNKIAETLTYFDFGAIREKLQPLEDAFADLLINIDKGKTEAIGNLGRELAEFTDSDEFQNFLDSIQHMMEVIDAETVEKILTGIGLGIGHIAEKVVNFVGSETFNAFLDDLHKWFEESSAEDIAKILERLAGAIAMFKFAEFASAGLAKFFTFAELLKSFKDIETISKNLGLIGKDLGIVGIEGAAAGEGGILAAGGLSAIAAPAAIVVAVIAAVVIAAYSLIESFGGLDELLMRLREEFEKVASRVKKVAEALGFFDIVDQLKDAFQRLGEKLGKLQSFWDLLIRAVGWVATIFISSFVPAVEVVMMHVTAFIDVISTAIDILGILFDVIKGVIDAFKALVHLDFGGFKHTLESTFKDAGERGAESFTDAISTIKNRFTGTIEESNESAVAEASNGAKRIAGTYAQDYSSEIKNLEGTFTSANSEVLNNAVNNVDYGIAGDAFANLTLSSLTGSVENSDYSGLSNIFSDIFGNSVLSGKDTFDTANAETASSGAQAFNSEYLNSFANNGDMSTAMNTYGKESVAAFSRGMEEEIQSQSIGNAIANIFKQINETSKTYLQTLKSNIATNFGTMISTLDFMTSFTTLFNRITEVITTNINTLGENLTSTVLPSFMETYVMTFFSPEMWQPYFDTLLNDVFAPAFEEFGTWFDKEAMTPFWEEHVLVWFEKTKWDDEAFTPLSENIHGHFQTFLDWWDESMRTWWDRHVVVWFEKTKWTIQFNHILEVAKEVFNQVKNVIQTAMQEASKAVEDSCNAMKSSIEDVITAIGQMMDALEGFEGFEGKVTFDFGQPTGFATGGFPQQGTLFYAGESGAEFVSSVNGRTGVVSNDEITGIADAVYSTGNNESALLTQLIAIGQAMLNKDPVVLSDKDLAMAVDRGRNRMGMTIIT